jgi:hypothetical protein
MTPLGIEPAALVVQCLNQLHHHIPQLLNSTYKIWCEKDVTSREHLYFGLLG